MNRAADFEIKDGVLLQYLGEEPDVTIPEGVQVIGRNAFRTFRKGPCIRSVVIPEGVLEIAEDAFYYQEGLTGLRLPASLQKIGTGAFYHCNGITTLDIPQGVTEIGQRAFAFCKGLQQIRLPEGLTELSSMIFYGCDSLTSLDIPRQVRIISDNAFRNCTALTHITIPEGVTELGNRAFLGCDSLKSLRIPQTCAIGDSAFAGCNGLADENGLVVFRNRLFSVSPQNPDNRRVVIPDWVERIDPEAFSGGQTPLFVEMSLTCPAWDAYSLSTLPNRSTISFRADSGAVVARIIHSVYDESGTTTVAAASALRQENRRFDFAGYDAVWSRLEIAENKTLVALTRLRYPYDLSGETQRQYTDHLKKEALNAGIYLIEEEQSESLAWMLEEGYFSESHLTRLVDHSSALGKTAVTALLLAKREKLPHSSGDFPAFHL